MKVFFGTLLLVSGIALAQSQLNLWTSEGEELNAYEGRLLGGDVTIQAVPIEDDKQQLRIKLAGVGSLPEGSFEYYITDLDSDVDLPYKQALIRTNEEWKPRPRQNPLRNRSFDIRVGDREELSGWLQSFPFSSSATFIPLDDDPAEN